MHESDIIDEAMIPFKGRLSFKQYINNTPTRWGIKAFVLSDVTTGYDAEADPSICSLDLMSGLEKEGFDLYTNNYYTSTTLYQSRKISTLVVTIRVNRRGFQPELVKQ